MRSRSSISLGVEQLEDRCTPSSIVPAAVASAAGLAPTALIATQATTNKDSEGAAT